MSKLMEAAGFRVGDEVEVVHPKITHVGVIKKITDYSKSSMLTFDYLYEVGNSERFFDETEIRHTRVLANPLNRKLYPNRIEIDGYLYRREIAERKRKENK